MEQSINDPAQFSTEKSQTEIVDEEIKDIEAESFMMNRSLDLGQNEEALDYIRKLIGHLQTSSLTPRNYYTLYHQVSTALFQFTHAVSDDYRFPNKKIMEMYEVVQYNASCLPRLYMMISLAPEIARRKLVHITELLDDLADMARGAQDPIRALFLRHFLLTSMKQYLPDSSDRETEFSMNFLLNNFGQMNRLWVRIIDLMAKDSRQSQCGEFSVLIGMNIQRLSTLHGLNRLNYSEIILPYLARHIEISEEVVCQEFILQSIIQAFPEEFHLATMEKLFSIFGHVEQNVRVLSIVNQLLDRVLGYAWSLDDLESNKKIFLTVARNVEELFNSESHLKDKFETLNRLMKFALRISISNVNNIMKFAAYHVDITGGDSVLSNPKYSRDLRQLIEIPIEQIKDLDFLTDIPHLVELIQYLRIEDKATIGCKICEELIARGKPIDSRERFLKIISVTSTLIRDGDGPSCFFSLLHLIDTGSVQSDLEIISDLADALQDATENASVKAVMPIGCSALRLLQKAEGPQTRHIVVFINDFCEKMRDIAPMNAVYLYIESARVVESLGMKSAANRFFEEAFDLFQDVPQLKLYLIFLRSVLESSVYDIDLNEKLSSLSLMIKDDSQQVLALAETSALFWRKDERVRDAPMCQIWLSNALTLASSIMSETQRIITLYSLLSTTVSLIEIGLPLAGTWLRSLITMIEATHEDYSSSTKNIDTIIPKKAKKFFQNTCKHIKDKKLLHFEN